MLSARSRSLARPAPVALPTSAPLKNPRLTDPWFTIRRLTPEEAEAFIEVRREALHTDPLLFALSPQEERDLPAVRRALVPDSSVAIFGAYDGNGAGSQLVGIAGLVRDSMRNSAHNVHLWGFYVRPSHRGRGAGGALLKAALRHARSLLTGVTEVQLSVTERAPEARLYERMGFVRWSTEPSALCWEGETVAEEHMVHLL